MAPTLLFITGVLAGLIAGFVLSRVFGCSRSGNGSGEIRLLEERLLKADQGLAQFSQLLQLPWFWLPRRCVEFCRSS